MRASQSFHQPWVYPASEQRRYRAYLDRIADGRAYGFMIARSEDNAFLGVININDPIFGGFRSASIGYYINADFARRGYMSEALALVLDYAFTTLQLHRLEANIQPANEASIGLVKRLGFRNEGFSPAFLQINGVWRDHERWAILAEEWLDASGLSTRQIRQKFGVVV
ncbi:MAG: GNAT family N-acetyltransferase [Rhodospirillaceae bacterium]|nr:GNAT family N-acetyltransferase [Rhodospirillaceae bacterium]